MGEVRYAARIAVGGAGNKVPFTAFVLGAGIPGSLRRGAFGSLGGQWDFP